MLVLLLVLVVLVFASMWHWIEPVLLTSVIYYVYYTSQILPEDLHAYMRDWFTSDRMVLVGAGVDHQELVTLAEECFVDIRLPSPAGSPLISVCQRP